MAVHHIKDVVPYAVNFSAVVAILAVILRNPLKKFLYQRHEHMKDAVDAAASVHRKALQRFNAAKGASAGLSQEVSSIATAEKKSAQAEAAEIAQRAQAETLRLNQEADRLAQVEADDASYKVRANFLNQVVAQTEDSLRRGLKKDDHSAILKRAQSSIEVGV
jgi:F0F1-type ATP synthase membrane subunit b/b'